MEVMLGTRPYLMYRGHCRSSAYSKEAFAKPRMEASVLYMAMATPAGNTVCSAISHAHMVRLGPQQAVTKGDIQ